MRKGSLLVLTLAAVVLLAVAAPPVDALQWGFLSRYCIWELIEVPFLEVDPGPIPVGCEVVDCCPGCPGPGPIDWLVRLEGDPVAQVALVFEGFDGAPQELLQLEGKTQWMEDGALQMDRGEVRITGIGRSDQKRAPVVVPRIRFDADALKELAADADPDAEGRDIGHVTLTIEQYVGRYLVNRASAVLAFGYCYQPAPPADKVRLTSNTSSDQAVIFLDGRKSGCRDDDKVRTATEVGVGNFVAAGGCNSETLVFSDDNAVAVADSSGVWTATAGDVQTIDLDPRWIANAQVWVAMPAAQRAATLTQAQNEIAVADGFYNNNNCGIGVQASANFTTLTNNTTITTITNAAQNVWTTGFCTQVGNISGSGSFTAGQLNIYYVNSAFTGWFCPGSNVIAIGTNAQPESLAHEFGHSFSLDHTEGADYDGDGTNDFANTNIMWGGGAGRTMLSEPQCFRASVDGASSLNTNGERTSGLTRNCPDATISATCPWLGDDVNPN